MDLRVDCELSEQELEDRMLVEMAIAAENTLQVKSRDRSVDVIRLRPNEEQELEDRLLIEMAIAAETDMLHSGRKDSVLDRLPDDVLKQIFGELPMMKLLLDVSCVCKRFHGIIQERTFLQWKKLYYEYRCTESTAAEERIQNVMAECGMTQVADAFVGCFIAVHKVFKHDRSFEQRNEIFDRISSHPHYSAACRWIEKVLWPKLLQRPSVWVYVAVTAALCENVREICLLFRGITASPSNYGTVSEHVAECFYFLAALFLACHRKYHISPRLHYNIFSAVFFCENSVVPDWKFQLTHEQLRLINYELKPKDCIRIIAFAGTGKTSTLRTLCENKSYLKFLVLMFNKDVAAEAIRSFPSNATCLTVNKLAKRHVYERVEYGRPKKKLGVQMIVNFLPSAKDFNSFLRAKDILHTVNAFLVSSRREILSEHLPPCSSVSKVPFARWKRQILTDSVAVWTEMMSPLSEDKKIPMTHDGYVKLFQLISPDFMTGYDVLCIDEAQDLNPVMVEPLMKQTCPKVVVGDPNQQIYAFRGAVNALDLFHPTKTFFLTQSFRFGPQIGYLATCWLEGAKKIREKLLIGCDKEGCLHRESLPAKNTPITIIARKNETIFEYCFSFVNRKSPKKLHVLGGCEKFLNKNKLEGWLTRVYKQHSKLRIRKTMIINDKFIRNFEDVNGLKKAAERYGDHELLGLISIMKKHPPNDVLKYCDMIKANHTGSVQEADIVLTTVHKAKGLEFDTVVLADDFQTLSELRAMYCMEIPYSLDSVELNNEINLLYVAMTRAKKCLIMNRALYEFMKREMNETFELASNYATRTVTEKGNLIPCCISCQKNLSGLSKESLVLYRRKIGMTRFRRNGVLPEGIICQDCAVSVGELRYVFYDANAMNQEVESYNSLSRRSVSINTSSDLTRRFLLPLFKDST